MVSRAIHASQNELIHTLALKQNDDESGNFVIYNYNGANTMVFSMDEAGNVTYSGALTGAFPRPVYDSGWRGFLEGEWRNLTHNLGGNPDNYVVDAVCHSSQATSHPRSHCVGHVYADANAHPHADGDAHVRRHLAPAGLVQAIAPGDY